MSALSKMMSTESQYLSLYDHDTCHHKNSYYHLHKISQLCFMCLLYVQHQILCFLWPNNINLNHIISKLFGLLLFLLLLMSKPHPLCCVVYIWNLNYNFHFWQNLMLIDYEWYMTGWCFYTYCISSTGHSFSYLIIYSSPMLVLFCFISLTQSRILIQNRLVPMFDVTRCFCFKIIFHQ